MNSPVPTQPQYIFIVGKAPGSPALLAQIRAQGYLVGLLADSHFPVKGSDRYDTVVSFDFSHLDRSVRELPIAAEQVAGMYCDYENYILPMAQIARFWGLPAISVEAARACTDKYAMRQAFNDFDPSLSPVFERIENLDDALGFAKRYGYPVMVKPTNLVKSLLVKKCSDETELRQHVAYVTANLGKFYEKYHIYDRDPGMLIEQYIVGASYSTAAYVDQHGTAHFCDGIVAITTAQDVGVDDTYLYSRILPADLPAEVSEAMFNTSRRGIKALGITSAPAHVELILTDDSDIKVVEIGARTGGYRPAMYAAAYGLDLYEQEINLVTGKPVHLQAKPRARTGVYELFPETEGAFAGIDGPRLTPDIALTVLAKPGDRVGHARNGLRAAAFVHVTSDTAALFSASCARVESLRVRAT